jgi:uncharacterized protein YijF (DUF1287 family)
LTRAARGDLQDRWHFENQERLIEAVLRREQLNAKPLGAHHRAHLNLMSNFMSTANRRPAAQRLSASSAADVVQ